MVGTVSRAIKELVHNSVQSSAKSCIVSVGQSEIIVSDDGVGIDTSAMHHFIGTDNCSNDSTNDGNGKRGESLRSIASLCAEMKVETACWAADNNRKRKQENGYIIQSEKVFKEGVVVSFNQSTGGSNSSSAIIPKLGITTKTKPGTKVTIRGLFHRHAVRRKHQEKSTNSTEFTQIRSSLRLLALCYPNVAFLLKDGSTGKVDCSYKSPQWAHKFAGPLTSSLQTSSTTSPSLSVESRALILRLCELHPDDFSPVDT